MKKWSLQQKNNAKGYWFLTPFLLGFLLLFAYPLVQSFLYSLGGMNTEAGYQIQVTGLDNYVRAIREDAKFYRFLIDSLGNMATKIPVILIFSFLIANLLKTKFAGRNLIRLIFFLPVILASGVVPTMEAGNLVQDMMSSSMSSASTGLVNETSLQTFLMDINFPSTMSSYIITAVSTIVEIINSSGIQILIFLAALQAIPSSLYEASVIEGATAWENFWKITFPLVTPQLIVCLVYTIVDSFCSPNNSVIDYIYEMAFYNLQYGFASAMAWIYTGLIIVVLLVFAGLASRLARRYEQ